MCSSFGSKHRFKRPAVCPSLKERLTPSCPWQTGPTQLHLIRIWAFSVPAGSVQEPTDQDVDSPDSMRPLPAACSGSPEGSTQKKKTHTKKNKTTIQHITGLTFNRLCKQQRDDNCKLYFRINAHFLNKHTVTSKQWRSFLSSWSLLTSAAPRS